MSSELETVLVCVNAIKNSKNYLSLKETQQAIQKRSSVVWDIILCYLLNSRSQWPRGLRHEMSSLARTFRS
jgi:hypothetical protein